ncbi:hypothetical protein [Streptomyces xanthochromogenes]|uniref:hypothetical protein n=1 Tax=Streptomyces xanthochromogenes TaxID=67384 RepID=UPI003428459C
MLSAAGLAVAATPAHANEMSCVRYLESVGQFSAGGTHACAETQALSDYTDGAGFVQGWCVNKMGFYAPDMPDKYAQEACRLAVKR